MCLNSIILEGIERKLLAECISQGGEVVDPASRFQEPEERGE